MSKDEILNKKHTALKEYLKSLKSVAIAFSSGVDSTFLLKTAHEVLGPKAIAVTAVSPLFPKREKDEASDFCKKLGIKQITIQINELEIDQFRHNPKDRCYICKKVLFTKIIEAAKQNGAEYVCEGSNIDDTGDYRPGLKAVAELGIKSPLKECELYKAEIRELSKKSKLSTWNKPSFACLASRFVYGEEITSKKLGMVEKAEQYLLDLGFKQFRVRIHGENLARIEVLPEDQKKLFNERQNIVSYFNQAGFNYVTMDLQGYRTGAMNEVLKTGL